jgi:hypothetical protein
LIPAEACRSRLLRQIPRGPETIRARTVVPLLISFQFQLQAQIFNMQFFSPLLLFLGTLPLIVALYKQQAHHRSKRFTIIG